VVQKTQCYTVWLIFSRYNFIIEFQCASQKFYGSVIRQS